MTGGNSEDSLVMEDIAYEDNFEEDVQTALVHTDKVRFLQHPSPQCKTLPVKVA
ncbi:hypothetical protein ABBQ32_006544 [Trebouxia sp. C0010 RCD-2024]